ncbi:glycosyltransferase family 4 protein [Halofilum ochraceum]|uniref:glycosyltransferase family 4 protein n=1 Tax=Halofilum ochraceum TaxID=1611323 RepID=UPI000AF20AD5|nr:glycosyltransferase family 4 protein [Halofilum ochraceum]
MHVVMLVNNSCVNDSRVIKSAEALVHVGHEVTVVCRQFGDLPVREERNGVQYHRVEPVPLDWPTLKSRVRTAVIGRSRLGGVGSVRVQAPDKTQATTPSAADSQNNGETDGLARSAGKTTVPASEVTSSHDTRRSPVSGNDSGENSPKPAGVSWRCATRNLPPPVKRLAQKLLRGVKRIVRGAIRIAKKTLSKVKRLGKRIMATMYWFSETDEFGTAARRHIAELRPDAVHAHDLTTLPAGGRAAADVGGWLVYDSHELEMHRNSSYPWFVWLRRRILERKYIRRADAVVTVSESIADHLRTDYGIPRPAVVMNAPLFDANITPGTTVRQDIGLGPDDKLCVYVGNVTVNRGLDLVVRALATMPDLHFATVGPRRLATETELVALAIELGVRDRLHLIDPVAPNEVVGYIGTADVSVLPIQNVCLSYYYCMPNKLLESVFAGVPVAVSDLLEMRRFVDANACGVVMDETDPEAIGRAIHQAITARARYILSPERRVELAEQYGWPAQAAHLQALYSRFCTAMPPKSLADESR